MFFIILIILSLISTYLLPWWAVAIVVFLVTLFMDKTSTSSFWSGFGAVALAWMILALVKSIPNENILASRMVQLFPLPNHWISILLVTGLIGGLIGGMAALSGTLLKKTFRN